MAKRTTHRKRNPARTPVRGAKKVTRTTAAKTAKRPRRAAALGRTLLTNAVSRLKKRLRRVPKLESLHILPVGGADVLRTKKAKRTRR